jgi:methionine-rich copper-binding protein CopC
MPAGRPLPLVVAVAVVSLLGLIVVAPTTAWAHQDPVAAVPGAGAALATAPAEVTLTFANEVDPGQSHVVVSDSAGTNVAAAEYGLPEPRLLRLPVHITAPGDYTVAYHITFIDGTSVTALYRFSVGTGKAPAALDDTAAATATEAVAGHAHGVDGLSALLLVADGVVLLGALAVLRLRPRAARRGSSERR